MGRQQQRRRSAVREPEHAHERLPLGSGPPALLRQELQSRQVTQPQAGGAQIVSVGVKPPQQCDLRAQLRLCRRGSKRQAAFDGEVVTLVSRGSTAALVAALWQHPCTGGAGPGPGPSDGLAAPTPTPITPEARRASLQQCGPATLQAAEPAAPQRPPRHAASSIVRRAEPRRRIWGRWPPAAPAPGR